MSAVVYGDGKIMALTAQTIVIVIVNRFGDRLAHIARLCTSIFSGHFAKECVIVVVDRTAYKLFLFETRSETLFTIGDLYRFAHKAFELRLSSAFE